MGFFGGYKLVDFKGINLVTNAAAVEITNIYSRATGLFVKRFVANDLVIDGKDYSESDLITKKDDDNNIVAVCGDKVITITPQNMVSVKNMTVETEVEWGNITGDMQEQADLMAQLNNIYIEIDGKQDTLTAGTNITIDENNVISATGGGESNVFLANLSRVRGTQTTWQEMVDAYNAGKYIVAHDDTNWEDRQWWILVDYDSYTKNTMYFARMYPVDETVHQSSHGRLDILKLNSSYPQEFTTTEIDINSFKDVNSVQLNYATELRGFRINDTEYRAPITGIVSGDYSGLYKTDAGKLGVDFTTVQHAIQPGLGIDVNGATVSVKIKEGKGLELDSSGLNVKDYIGPTSESAGQGGIITPPVYGDRAKFFRGDGEWADPGELSLSNYIKSMSVTGGTSGAAQDIYYTQIVNDYESTVHYRASEVYANDSGTSPTIPLTELTVNDIAYSIPTADYTGSGGINVTGKTISIDTDHKLPTTEEWDEKQDTLNTLEGGGINITQSGTITVDLGVVQGILTAGENITIDRTTNTISATAGESENVEIIEFTDSATEGYIQCGKTPAEIITLARSGKHVVAKYYHYVEGEGVGYNLELVNYGDSAYPYVYFGNNTGIGWYKIYGYSDTQTDDYVFTSGSVPEAYTGSGGISVVGKTISIDTNHKLPTTEEWSGKQDTLNTVTGGGINITGSSTITVDTSVIATVASVESGLAEKQDTLTASGGLNITGKTITVDANHIIPTTTAFNNKMDQVEAGSGISLTSSTIAVDFTTVQQKPDTSSLGNGNYYLRLSKTGQTLIYEWIAVE